MFRDALLLSCVLVLLLASAYGCAPSRKYAWGSYDTALYSHYKNSQEKEAHLERLTEIVQNAEAEDKVPPGLYAEYGYVLYEFDNIPQAIIYFEKEKAKWPESAVLMQKMIRNAGLRQKSQSKKTDPAPAAAPDAVKEANK